MSKKIVITEKEKSRISKIHNQRILMEREGQQQPAAPTAPAAPAATTPPPTEPRYKTSVCPGKDTKGKCDNTVLKVQIRMNDECPSDVLTTKLLEDGVYGSKTGTAWGACKPKLTPTKQVQGGGSQQQGTAGNAVAQGPKIGEPITANDIATLTT